LVAHHTSNGCNLRPGDLIASGTLSGPTDDALGCLLELTRGGTAPIALPSGEARRWLAEGDEVRVSAFCERPGHPRIGFGSCVGRVMSTSPLS
jgi:fumarylacetoacetase